MDQNRIKISIITVCLNGAETIEQTIQSVISQDYSNIEYIILDGGSTDGTLDIIRKYEGDITYWTSEPDAGIFDAMNKGIQLATGDYIAFLNSDDWYEEKAISYVANDIMENSVEIACYNINMCHGNIIEKWDNKRAEESGNLRIGMCYSHQAIFASKKIFETYGGFNIKYRICADYDWLLRAYNNGIVIRYKDVIVANYRLGGLSDSNKAERDQEEESIARTALEQLKRDNKISEDEFCKIQEEIREYYKKLFLSVIIELALDSQIILKNKNLKLEMQALLPKRKYSIFGNGNFGIECCTLLQQLGFQVECFWDNNPKKWGTLCRGIDVKSPQKIQKGGVGIIISTNNYVDEISEQLKRIGLKEDIDYMDYNTIRDSVGNKLKKYMS